MLRDQVVVVTGAGTGIGRAIALAAAREGAHVGVHFCGSEAGARAVQAEIRALHDRPATLLGFDLRDPGALERVCAPFVEAAGRLDGWVNNAAVNRPGLLPTLPEAAIRETLEVNLLGPIHAARFALPAMLRRRTGAFVNVGSVAARQPWRGQAVYAASKGGLASFTRALAAEYGRKGIRANCVEPGPTETAMLAATKELAGEGLVDRLPGRRLGTPGEIAEVVVFLLSGRASFVNGAVLAADGGYGLA